MAASLIAIEIIPETGEIKFLPEFCCDSTPTKGAELIKFLEFASGFYNKSLGKNNEIWFRCARGNNKKNPVTGEVNGYGPPEKWYLEFGEPCA